MAQENTGNLLPSLADTIKPRILGLLDVDESMLGPEIVSDTFFEGEDRQITCWAARLADRTCCGVERSNVLASCGPSGPTQSLFGINLIGEDNVIGYMVDTVPDGADRLSQEAERKVIGKHSIIVNGMRSLNCLLMFASSNR